MDKNRLCHRCRVEKYENDFYTFTNGDYKRICKQCENTNASKYELYTCEVCYMIIRKRNKRKHENSYRHQHCKFWCHTYDSNRLQPQHRRL